MIRTEALRASTFKEAGRGREIRKRRVRARDSQGE
jgi:hypothetical protein